MLNIKITKPIVTLFVLLSTFNLSSKEVTLEDFLEAVEVSSKDLKNAQIEQLLAAKKKDLSITSYFPTISGSMGYSRNIIERTQSYAVGASTIANDSTGLYDLVYAEVPANFDNEIKFQLGVQQTIVDVAALNGIKSGELYSELTNTTYEQIRDSIITASKKLYFQALLLKEVYNLRVDSEANALENFKQSEEKFNIRQISELEMLQAKVNWQSTIPETSMAKRNLELVMSNLKQFAGYDSEEQILLASSLLTIPTMPGDITLAEVLTNRNDLKILKQSLGLQDINVNIKKAAFLPVLKANAGLGFNYYSDNELDSMDVTALQVGLTLSLPVYYGGSRFIQLDQAELERDKAALSVVKKTDEIETEINNLKLLLEESNLRIKGAELTLETTTKAYEITEISVDNGMATQLDMKDALLSLNFAKLNYYSAVFDYLSGYFDWQQATGQVDIKLGE